MLNRFVDFIEQEFPKFYSSQRAFAKACNLDESTIRNLRTRESYPNLLTLSRIANAFNMPLSELFAKIENS
ncbi:MAG: helix-turn-helix transcriptional regulator [Crocinitomicaceae bacterium]|nr:helix-turn-helix transcriptional regulator [Crocinitomicaceae bacterium]